MLVHCSRLVMCCSWLLYVTHCSLCVVHVCCMLLPAHYVCVPHVCSIMLYVAHCTYIGVAYTYFILLTAHSLSLTLAMWYTLLITCEFLMFAACCSLLMGCSYPLCGLQLNICCSYQCIGHEPNTYTSFYVITALKYICIYKSNNIEQ